MASPLTPATGGSAVSNDAFLTALKNVVTAINGQTQNATNIAGAQDFFALTSATLVKSGAGRVVNVSVIVAGSAVGHVYDTVSLTDTSRPIYVIPMTVGVVQVNIPTQYGIVIAPGSGQTVSGSYS